MYTPAHQSYSQAHVTSEGRLVDVTSMFGMYLLHGVSSVVFNAGS